MAADSNATRHTFYVFGDNVLAKITSTALQIWPTPSAYVLFPIIIPSLGCKTKVRWSRVFRFVDCIACSSNTWIWPDWMQHPQVVTDSRFQVNHLLHFSWKNTFPELFLSYFRTSASFLFTLFKFSYKIPCKQTVQGDQAIAKSSRARQVQLKPDTHRQRSWILITLKY